MSLLVLRSLAMSYFRGQLVALIFQKAISIRWLTPFKTNFGRWEMILRLFPATAPHQRLVTSEKQIPLSPIIASVEVFMSNELTHFRYQG